MLAELIAEAKAEIVVEDGLPELLGHPGQLRTLLQNLVENAIKYRHADRAPKIRIAPADKVTPDTVGFAVRDNGVGIAADHQERIFELFKRLHRSDEVLGAGIGLTLCRRVALNHGGDIRVASDPTTGTAFTVSFPRMRS